MSCAFVVVSRIVDNFPSAIRQSLKSMKNVTKRVEKYHDPVAMNAVGRHCKAGSNGFPLDVVKALDLF